MGDSDTGSITSEQVDKVIPNPEGKGGFADHPENINAGGRPKNPESFTYWYRVFKDMTVQELKEWREKHPESERTVASDLALTRVIGAKADLKEFQEVADRSEGRAPQTVRHEGEVNIGLISEVAANLQNIYKLMNDSAKENGGKDDTTGTSSDQGNNS